MIYIYMDVKKGALGVRIWRERERGRGRDRERGREKGRDRERDRQIDREAFPIQVENLRASRFNAVI